MHDSEATLTRRDRINELAIEGTPRACWNSKPTSAFTATWLARP